MAKEKITGAMAVRRALEAEGVEYVFGMPGGTILPIYDAMFGCEKPQQVLIRHEQVGGHAAEGFAHATGKVGVCFGTSGPGATNLVTAIADAYMDSVPLVAITGNVATSLIGSDAFQEADITGITMPITKHNWLVTDVHDLPRILKEAFYVARTGRPGPVLVDIPKDIQNTEFEFEYPDSVSIPGYHPPVREEPRLKDAATLIRSSSRPIIYLGGGVRTSDAHREVAAFAELLGAPVVTTVHGKGAFPETSPQCLGMFGMHGSKFANYAVQNADLLIALGARFDDRVTGKLSTFAPEAKVVHLDVDPAEISKLVTATVPLVGDLKRLLPQLTEEVRRLFGRAGPGRPRPVAEAGGGLAGEAPAQVRAGRGRSTCSRSTSSRPSGRRPAARRWSPPASASTRCSRPSGGRPPGRASSSPRAASAPWASACRRPSASSSGAPASWSSASTATAPSR